MRETRCCKNFALKISGTRSPSALSECAKSPTLTGHNSAQKRFLDPNLIPFNSPHRDLSNGVQFDGFPDIKFRPARIAA